MIYLNHTPFSIWIIFFIFFLTSVVEVMAARLPDIYWNSTNPMFRIDNTDHIIDVNRGNTAYEYDQINIICPMYSKGTSREEDSGGDMETYIIYNVSKEEYDSCHITNKAVARTIAVCDKPFLSRYFTITFRPFTPQPGGLEFRPGQDYYFIALPASDNDPNPSRPCQKYHMKVVFKVCCKRPHQPSIALTSARPSVVASNNSSSTTISPSTSGNSSSSSSTVASSVQSIPLVTYPGVILPGGNKQHNRTASGVVSIKLPSHINPSLSRTAPSPPSLPPPPQSPSFPHLINNNNNNHNIHNRPQKPPLLPGSIQYDRPGFQYPNPYDNPYETGAGAGAVGGYPRPAPHWSSKSTIRPAMHALPPKHPYHPSQLTSTQTPDPRPWIPHHKYHQGYQGPLQPKKGRNPYHTNHPNDIREKSDGLNSSGGTIGHRTNLWILLAACFSLVCAITNWWSPYSCSSSSLSSSSPSTQSLSSTWCWSLDSPPRPNHRHNTSLTNRRHRLRPLRIA